MTTKKTNEKKLEISIKRSVRTVLAEKNIEDEDFVSEIAGAVMSSNEIQGMKQDIQDLKKNVDDLSSGIMALVKSVGYHQVVIKTILGVDADGNPVKKKDGLELPQLWPTEGPQKSNKPN